MIEGSLEIKLPTIWTNEKQRWEESEKRREEKRREDKRREDKRREERRKKKEERRKNIKKEKVSEERRSRCAKKVGKSRNTVFFQWFAAPEGRKVGSLKRRARSQLAR